MSECDLNTGIRNKRKGIFESLCMCICDIRVLDGNDTVLNGIYTEPETVEYSLIPFNFALSCY